MAQSWLERIENCNQSIWPYEGKQFSRAKWVRPHIRASCQSRAEEVLLHALRAFPSFAIL